MVKKKKGDSVNKKSVKNNIKKKKSNNGPSNVKKEIRKIDEEQKKIAKGLRELQKIVLQKSSDNLKVISLHDAPVLEFMEAAPQVDLETHVSSVPVSLSKDEDEVKYNAKYSDAGSDKKYNESPRIGSDPEVFRPVPRDLSNIGKQETTPFDKDVNFVNPESDRMGGTNRLEQEYIVADKKNISDLGSEERDVFDKKIDAQKYKI